MIKVAALQAPYSGHSIGEAIAIIRESVVQCENGSIDILCCPEGFLGGLADYAQRPDDIAIDAGNGELEDVLAPIASESVAVIVGFTEKGGDTKLYNAAAVYFGGGVINIYRKVRPAIRHSVYSAGKDLPVFEIKGLKFGIQICNDSNFPEQTATLAGDGAKVLFVPSNNALPYGKADVAKLTREVDRSLALGNSIFVVRADVAGHFEGLVAYGSSEIVAPSGDVLASARRLRSELIAAEIEVVTSES